MLGKLNPQIKQVTVIGAGISGLLTAYRLDRAGYEVTLIEAEAQAGGLISTRETPYGIAETAAHSFLVSDAVRNLCRDLSLNLVFVRAGSRARFIFRHEEMKRVPLSFFEMMGLLKRVALIRAPHGRRSEETLEDWARRHIGKPALDYLLSPFLVGVYGAAASELSLDAAFPKLQILPGDTLLDTLRFMKAASAGRKKTARRMATFENGMGSLVSALSECLRKRLGARFRLGERMEKIPTRGNVVLAVTAPAAARILGSDYPATREALGRVKYAPLVTCTVFIRNDRHRVARGVGVLIPPTENRKILGVLFNSSSFPGRVKDDKKISSYTVMLGGTLRPEMTQISDAQIRTVVEEELKDFLKLEGLVEHFEMTRWREAIPLYSSQLQKLWKTADEELSLRPGLVLFGNYTGQVSLRGMIETSLKFMTF